MNYIKLIVLFVTLLFFRCSEKPTDLGGGASGNGNAIISGKVLKSNGTPAINANILLVPVSIDPTASNGNPTVISAKTDGAGIYSINTPLSGNWNAFANDGLGNVAFNDSLALTGDSTVLPPLLLKSKGKLQIVFKTQPQHDPRLIDVIFWGTNRVLVPVSRDGLMIVDDLAEGTYPVRIKLSTEYAVIDTHFTIRAGETSGKDTITLPYLSIPVVTGLKAEYDTLNGKVYISWNGIDTTKITGYNIYRSSVDSNSSNVLINTVPVVKTTFVDSFSVFGSTYLYRIKAIGKNGDLCPIYSASASVNAVNRLMVTTVIELRTFNTKNDTASINDIVGFIATFANPTRNNVEIVWYLDTVITPYKSKVLAGVSSSVETLKVAWNNVGVHKVKVRIKDNANYYWVSEDKQCNIVLDIPIAEAGNDTMVKAGNSINLHGRAADRFGAITEWAWDIGNKGSFTTSTSGSATVNTVAGLSNMNYLCILRVKDDDGNQDYDTVRIAIYDQFVPIKLSGIKVTGVGTETAQVTWSSEYAAFGKVQYGKTPACSEGEVSSGLDIDHVAILKGLTSDAVYFYRVISSNSEDADTSDVFAFSTRAGTNSIYKIKKLPANAIPAIDGNLQDWPREYIIGTITGDDNVFARESNSPMDASTNWNGELYAGWHDTIAYFAIRVTTDDVYKLGSGITPNQFDNIKVNPGGSGKAFYLWSDGVMTKNPACLFDNGTTLKQKVNSTSNGGLPVYEFSFPYDYLTPSVAIDEFRLNIGTEDADADGSSKLFLGFGVYYIGSKQEWETGNWNNPAYYPTFKLIE